MKKNRIYQLLTSPLIISFFLLTVLILISSDSIMGNDEGMWSYIGRIWGVNHIPPYAGAIENKTPGIFELHAISNILFGINIFFVRVLGIVSILLTSFVVFLIGRKLHSDLAGIFGMYIFGLTMTWKSMDGSYVSQTETFMVLFSTLSFYFAMKGKDSRKWKYWLLLAGLAIGFAIVFKQIALSTSLALLFFIFMYTTTNMTKQNKLFGLILLAFGIVISTWLSLIPLLLSGVSLKEYLDGAWLTLLNPSSSASLKDRIQGFFMVWQDSRIVVFYPCLILVFLQRDLIKNRYFIGLLIWLLSDFIGVNSSGTYFGHQIKQLIPSLSIITGILLSNVIMNNNSFKGEYTKYVSFFLLTVIIIILPYELLFTRGCQIAGRHANKSREIGIWLKEHTDNSQYVYVMGSQGNPILYYSARVSSSKYFNSLFISNDAESKKLLVDLNEKPPVYILKPQFPAYKGEMDMLEKSKIGEFITNNYSFLQNKYNYDIFKRK